MAEVLPREESSLSLLVNNQRLSDVEILIGKDKVPFYATKAILSVNSEYFNEVFFCQPEPGSNGKWEFPGIESDTFLRFLKFCYTNEFNIKMDGKDVWRLLAAAKKFVVESLMKKCRTRIIQGLTSNNAINNYLRAVGDGDMELEAAILRFVDWSFHAVSMTPGFLELDVHTLCHILDRPTLRIGPSGFLQAVRRWRDAPGFRGLQPVSVSASKLPEQVVRSIENRIGFPFVDFIDDGDILSDDDDSDSSMDVSACDNSDTTSMEQFAPMKFRQVPGGCSIRRKRADINPESYKVTIKFTADKLMFLHGLSFYVWPQWMKATILVRRQVENGGWVKVLSIRTPGESDFMNVMFECENEAPIMILPEVKYALCITDQWNIVENFLFSESSSFPRSEIYIGDEDASRATIKIENIPTNFSPANSKAKGYTTVGPIPELIFSF